MTAHDPDDDAPAKSAPPHAGEPLPIQGELHSFHARAAELLLPGCQPQPTRSFPELARDVAATPGSRGLMAIENSVAGALLTNYLLLEEHDLRIVGETYLRISHSVLVPKGATWDSVRQLESHPMALAQCRSLFRARPALTPLERYDTAGAAREVAEAADLSRGAVAPAWCAAAYGLEVLAEAVEDNPHNWTRFVLVTSSATEQHVVDASAKTSVAFSVAHESGALLAALEHLRARGASMTKIQSLPLVGRPWEYRFFVDFAVDGGPSATDAILARLVRATTDLRHLGTYAAGQHYGA